MSSDLKTGLTRFRLTRLFARRHQISRIHHS